MQIQVYGAGNYTKKYLPRILNQFDVCRIIDANPQKAGEEIWGTIVESPTEKNVNEYPVFILISDINSAHRTLEKYGCCQKIYNFIVVSGGCAFYPDIKNSSIADVIGESVWFRNETDSFFNLKSEETDMEYKKEKNRYFEIASPTDFDAPGGPCACLRNLWIANDKYKLIDNFIVLCPSVVKKPKGMPEKQEKKSISLNGRINQLIFDTDVDFHEAIWLQLMMNSLVVFLLEAAERFGFSEDDTFLLQDPFITEAFILCFPHLKKVFAAYHVQGTLASELKNRYPTLAGTLNRIQKRQLANINDWLFPSAGAIEGFINTANEGIREEIQKCKLHVTYNGYEKKDVIHPDNEFVCSLQEIPDYDVLFASATFLYRNKGVERIPKVLSAFRKITGYKIHWILVGSGEMECEVDKQIQRYLVPDEYTWYRQRFDNQDNIFALFEKADFYIMMHYVSVFDLSTLQAMAYGCVPLLSDVGGNKELCSYNNGILINTDDIETSFQERFSDYLWDKEQLINIQESNINIVSDKFNNREFLKGYSDVICRKK